MDDVISRQAAIDVARDWYEGLICGSFKGLEKRLRALPSAQPSLDEWCTDCKEYDAEQNCCPRWNRVIRDALKETKDARPEIIRCGECKHRYTEGENVVYNVCELNHNKVQPDDWFCGDAERKNR